MRAEQPGKWKLINPSAAEWGAWDTIHAFHLANYPIRYFFQDYLRHAFVWRWEKYISRPWYYVKCAVWHRHNRIHLKNLPPTYTDIVTRLPHALYGFIEDYVEKENGGRDRLQADIVSLAVDYEEELRLEKEDPDKVTSGSKPLLTQLLHDKEVLRLYDFWQGRKKFSECMEPDELKGHDDFQTEEEYSAYINKRYEAEEKLQQEEEDNLISIVKLRRSLWT